MCALSCFRRKPRHTPLSQSVAPLRRRAYPPSECISSDAATILIDKPTRADAFATGEVFCLVREKLVGEVEELAQPWSAME